MVDIPAEISAFIICLVIAAAGGAVISSGSEIPMLITVGWIFLIGGIIGAGMSIFTMVRN